MDNDIWLTMLLRKLNDLICKICFKKLLALKKICCYCYCITIILSNDNTKDSSEIGSQRDKDKEKSCVWGGGGGWEVVP